MNAMPKEIKASTSNTHRPSPMAVTTSGSNRTASTWSPQDDETLINARASGLNWQPIATKYFPSKTANACRKRHERLMERRNAEDWEGVRLETLAKEYMNVRREMWTILADRVGEKWTMVEQKCMEKGFKNLQSAHRSAQRKERGIYEEGDSGIGCSDAENETDDGPSEMAQSAQGGYPMQQRGGPSIQSMLSPTPTHGQV